MSRSKHTDPRSIRAARRVRGPFQTRGAGDLSLRRKLGRVLKELGGIRIPAVKETQDSELRVRIIWRQPSRGCYHPIRKRDLLKLLESVGPLVRYGLQSIELGRAPVISSTLSLNFGRYLIPGRIILFEQRLPPWRLPGLLGNKTVYRFERAGAVVKPSPEVGATLVDWPGDSLRRFMLEEVLLHELGHHVLQHYKAKRLARIARTKDHEAFAELFAVRQRLALPARKTQTR